MLHTKNKFTMNTGMNQLENCTRIFSAGLLKYLENDNEKLKETGSKQEGNKN